MYVISACFSSHVPYHVMMRVQRLTPYRYYIEKGLSEYYACTFSPKPSVINVFTSFESF